MNVYKLLSEIDPGTQDVLDMPTPAWLDREYPYVPPPGTDCALKELEYLISLIPERGKWSAFIKDADEDMQGLFVTLCSELGVPCDRKSLDSMVSDAVVLITKLKWLYNRPRPYQVAAKHGISFTPMSSKTAHTPAYPSGHTIQAYLLASRLSERAPQHRKAFMKLAHLISYSRMVGGYHWPSDITFGKDVFRHAVMPHMPSSVRVASKHKDKKGHRTASWMKAKRFFPGVRNPVFHATTGPRAASIALRGEGIKSNSGFSHFGTGNKDGSVSLSRDLNFLLKGGFGNVIFVLDLDELNRKFPVSPHAYPNWEDEYEERVFTDKIPPSLIRGVILRYKPLGFELDEWESEVDYPVVYTDDREWGSRIAAAWDRHPDGRLLGFKVMGYDPETRQLISGADSRQRFPLRKGVHRMRAPGIFLAATPSYVLDYYANFENNALLTYAFDAADVTTGNLGDREPEITVPEAELVGWSLYDEDLNPMRVATLSNSEREDREDEAQVRQSPKKKPPRTDKERRMVKDKDNSDEDPDAKQDRKDRSTNFKDASARVALRFLLAEEDGDADADGGKGKVSGAFIQFMEEEGDTEVNNPDTGNKAKVRSLRGPKGRKEVQRMFQDWLDKKKKKDKAKGSGDSGDTPSEEKPEAPVTRGDAEEAIDKFLGKSSSQLKDLDDDEIRAVAEILEGASDQISESLDDPSSWSKILQKAGSASDVLGRVGEENSPSPQEIAEAIIASRTAEMVKDPNLLFSARPLDQVSLDDVGDDMTSVRSEVADRAVESFDRYQAMDKDVRDAHRESLEKTIKDLEADGKDNSQRYATVLGQYQGLVVASVVEDGDDARGVSPIYAGVLRAAQSQGRIKDFVRTNITGAASGKEVAQAQIRKVIEDIDNDDFVDMIPEDNPAHDMVSALTNDDYLATMDQESQDMLRQLANDFMLDGIVFADADLVGQGKTVKEIKKDPGRVLQRPSFKALSDWWDKILAAVREGKKASVQPTWDFTPWPSVLCVSRR